MASAVVDGTSTDKSATHAVALISWRTSPTRSRTL